MHILQHPLRLELIRVGAVNFGVEMEFTEETVDGLALFDGVFAGEDGVFVGLEGETGDGRVETEGFAEDLL